MKWYMLNDIVKIYNGKQKCLNYRIFSNTDYDAINRKQCYTIHMNICDDENFMIFRC